MKNSRFSSSFQSTKARSSLMVPQPAFFSAVATSLSPNTLATEAFFDTCLYASIAVSSRNDNRNQTLTFLFALRFTTLPDVGGPLRLLLLLDLSWLRRSLVILLRVSGNVFRNDHSVIIYGVYVIMYRVRAMQARRTCPRYWSLFFFSCFSHVSLASRRWRFLRMEACNALSITATSVRIHGYVR